MRTSSRDAMPAKVARALKKLGQDISLARRKRQLTAAMMCERAGISKQTYQRTENGDPTVSMGVYAMCLFVLGLDGGLGDLADPRGDDSGLLFDRARVPKRVRTTRNEGEAM